MNYELQTISVLSINVSERETTTIFNLGVSFVHILKKVLIIEGDCLLSNREVRAMKL